MEVPNCLYAMAPRTLKLRSPHHVRGREFFDARDAVQVKYEMVRAVTVDEVLAADPALLAAAHTADYRCRGGFHPLMSRCP
jgi:hypothetical protein